MKQLWGWGVKASLAAAAMAMLWVQVTPAQAPVTLFDGKNLDNFVPVGNANWKLANGIVEATDGNGVLLTKNSYRDFELHVEVWVDDPANSGIFIRCSNRTDVTQDTAYEVNIYDHRPDQTHATGAIVNVASANPKMIAADKWNTFDITAEGDHLVVVMNGTKTVDVRDRKFAEGPIALQRGAGVVRFRSVTLRPLPAAAAQNDAKGKGQAKGGNNLIRPLADVQKDLGDRLEKITVHGKSLEGNLDGDSADREVFVYLPPSYRRDSNRRYPVAYMLHGFGLHATQWVGFINVAAADKHAAEKEMIVVMPDAFTIYNGSFYSNSKASGNWEQFIAKDLVSYIDSHYRTKANRLSRGLGGHSMGGYGTLRIGLKYPDVFSSIYSMSGAGIFESGAVTPDIERAGGYKTKEEVAALPYTQKSPFARAAAWSANPAKPPFYVDLPVVNGKQDPTIAAKWMANSILVMMVEHADAYRQMKAFNMDVGLQDNLLATNRDLDAALTSYGIAHHFETYEGDHNGKVPERFDSKVLPFFAKNLE